MKNLLLSLILCLSVCGLVQAQTTTSNGHVITLKKSGRTQIKKNKRQKLSIHISERKLAKYIKKGFISYRNLNAKGDGKTDDIDAIAGTHAIANLYNLSVKASNKATYYIGGKSQPVYIQTSTDFGSSAFIIDDTEVQSRYSSIFIVSSNLKPYIFNGIDSLHRNQTKIDKTFSGQTLITAINTFKKKYIRYGLNKNGGTLQTDIFVVDENGLIDMKAPIIWDFNKVTRLSALPIDKTPLTITGGKFTTIANKAESRYNYYKRNIAIKRSNVVIDGLEHYVVNEGSQGAPYRGFIDISDCVNVTVKNSVFTGRKTYKTIGRAGKPVSMGSYDLSVNRALNVTFKNCTQSNDINDRKFWGIIASNYSKNIVFDSCKLSRFDAHKGVANATIKNSTLGHMGINAIGSGTLTLENTTISAGHLINLRQDYGSTWEGNIIIRNCIFRPRKTKRLNLINGSNSGKHDFGYTCYMPETITIENLYIDDSNFSKPYSGPFIFSNFNPEMLDNSFVEDFPYVLTKEVIMKNVTTKSGKDLTKSKNQFMFRNTKITHEK